MGKTGKRARGKRKRGGKKLAGIDSMTKKPSTVTSGMGGGGSSIRRWQRSQKAKRKD